MHLQDEFVGSTQNILSAGSELLERRSIKEAATEGPLLCAVQSSFLSSDRDQSSFSGQCEVRNKGETDLLIVRTIYGLCSEVFWALPATKMQHSCIFTVKCKMPEAHPDTLKGTMHVMSTPVPYHYTGRFI